jgi:hypothetical protein
VADTTPEAISPDDHATTAALIYEHTRDGPARQAATSDAVDSKAFQLFSAASVVLGFGTFASGHLNTTTAVLYGLAAAAYLLVACFTWQIVQPRRFQVTTAADRWWPSHEQLAPHRVRERLLDDLAGASKENRAILAEKTKPLGWLMAAAGVEVLLIAAAVIAGQA